MRSLLITLSVAIKPGALHRLTLSGEFEQRLMELAEVLDPMEEAYRRGRNLALGKVTSQGMGLGQLVGRAVREAFDASGQTPLTGLWTASVVMSSIAGYADEAGIDMVESLRTLIVRVLYGSSPADAEELLSALADVNDSDLVNYLADKGITQNYIAMNALTLGDLFENLYQVDLGFMLNLKSYQELVRASKILAGSQDLTSGVVRAYMHLASPLLAPDAREAAEQGLDLKRLARLDKALEPMRSRYNRVLGGLFYSVVLGLAGGAPLAFSSLAPG